MSGALVALAGLYALAAPPVDTSGTPRLDGLRPTQTRGTSAVIHVGMAGLAGHPVQGVAGFGALYAPVRHVELGFGLMNLRGGGLQPLVRPGAMLVQARVVGQPTGSRVGASLSIAAPVARLPDEAPAATEIRLGGAPALGRFRMLANAVGWLAIDGSGGAWAGVGAEVELPLGARLVLDGGLDLGLGWTAGACLAFPVAAGVQLRVDASASRADGVVLRLDLGVRTGVDGAGVRLRNDRDRDGVANEVDACPREFGEGADGCPLEVLASGEPCHCPLDEMSLGAIERMAAWLSAVEPGSVFVVGVRVKPTGDARRDYDATVAAAVATRAGLVDAGAVPRAFVVVGLATSVGTPQPVFSAERMTQRQADEFVKTFAIRPPKTPEDEP